MSTILQNIIATLTGLVIALSAQVSNLTQQINPTSQLAQAAAPTSGLVGYWNFDEGSGAVANDTSGNGNNGTISGATWTAGKVGSGALDFDGVDDGVGLSDPTILNFSGTNAFTISIWVYPLTGNTNGTVFGRGDVGSGAAYIAFDLYRYGFDDTRWRAEVSDGVTKTGLVTNTGTILANTWQNVVLVWDGAADRLEIYRDGISIGSISSTVNLWDGQRATSIGYDKRGNEAFFRGTIDDLRLYNRALSASEILDIYNDTGSTPPSPPPAATCSDGAQNQNETGVDCGGVCSACPVTPPPPTPTNGVCGTTQNLCTSGTLQDITDSSTNYFWNCNGQNGGTSASCLLTIPVTPPPSGNTFYIRDGGTGTTCSDWTNACDTLPTTLQRGATYYIADGNYPGYTFDDPVSGTQLITIKKAIIADHGTNTGWNNAYGDGQAIFSVTGNVLRFDTAYWVFDGQVGSGTSGYGFVIQMTSITASPAYGIHFYTQAASNITVRHTEIYHTDACVALTTNGTRQDAIRTAGADNITLQYVYLHDVPTNLIIAGGSDNWLVENSWLEGSHSTANNHGQAIFYGLPSASGWTIRYNTFKDINGSAVIFFSMRVADARIYGNVFWEEMISDCGGFATGNLLGANPGTDPTGVTGLRFYNNAVIDLNGRGSASDNIGFDIGSDNLAYNNIWYGTTPAFMNAVGDFNDVNVSDPSIFVNYAAGDFRLTRATNAGTTLSSSFNTDSMGNTRGSDGVWDRGAYEYVSGSTSPPPPPPATPIVGDLNLDHIVNSLDFSLMNTRWNQSYSQYDLQPDGVINSLDYAILSSNWMRMW